MPITYGMIEFGKVFCNRYLWLKSNDIILSQNRYASALHLIYTVFADSILTPLYKQKPIRF